MSPCSNLKNLCSASSCKKKKKRSDITILHFTVLVTHLVLQLLVHICFKVTLLCPRPPGWLSSIIAEFSCLLVSSSFSTLALGVYKMCENCPRVPQGVSGQLTAVWTVPTASDKPDRATNLTQRALGLKVNYSKSHLTPEQTVQFIGMKAIHVFLTENSCLDWTGGQKMMIY